MANDTVIKVSKASYETKIEHLQSLINKLDTTASKYESLRNEMDKFIDGSDSNYEMLRTNVEMNIKEVHDNKKLCETAVNGLKQTLREMEEWGDNVRKTISTAIDAGTNIFKAAAATKKLIK